jgi:HK97 family phage major capsid protein
LFNKSVVRQAGAIVVTRTSNFSLAKVSGATFAWRATETTAASESTPTTSLASFSPKTADGLVQLSEQHILQGSPSSDALIARYLIDGIGSFVDGAAINGSGSNGEPRGILNQSGVGAVSFSTGSPEAGGYMTYAKLREFIRLVAVSNNEGRYWLGNNNTVYAATTTAKVSSTDSVMISDRDDQLVGYPMLVSENVPSTLTKGTSGAVLSGLVFGDFSNAVIAEFGSVALRVTDSHGSNFSSGILTLRCTVFVDFGLLRNAAFAVAKDLKTA